MPCWTEKYCHICTHWRWGREPNSDSRQEVTPTQGYCALYSVSCNTAIFNHDRLPPRFQAITGEEIVVREEK